MKFSKNIMVFFCIASMTGITFASPVLEPNGATGATVTAASAENNNTQTINQSSQQAILNWKSFNIGSTEHTHFQQPAGGVALNRIDPSQGASQIFGQLSATGKIILVNQAGIYFGPGARVDVGGIIASTSNISDQNFMSGKYIFDQPSSYAGSIINKGQIIARDNGLVALVGTGISNEGLIQANLGNIVLASGQKFTVDLSGDQLVNFTVDAASSTPGVSAADGSLLKNGVSNKGQLIANGGTIILSAKTASNVLDNAIDMEGVATAQSVSQQNGEIILAGDDGTVNVAGVLDASGTSPNSKGGNVIITGQQVLVDSNAKINVDGDIEGGEILIGGNSQGATPLSLFNGQQILPNASYVTVNPGAQLSANAITLGDGGKVIVWSDDVTRFYGSISAEGGALGGNGGSAETSGHVLDITNAKINLLAANGKTGTWLLDPENLTIQNSGSTTASFSSNTYTSNVDNSIVTVADLEAALGTASIVVQTGAGGAQAGNLTVSDPVFWSNANSLTLTASHNVTIGASISNSNTGSLNINAGSGQININAGIALAGGTLTLSAPNAANSIQTGNAGTVNVDNFTLSQGQWTQTSASNPSFTVANDFQFADGTTFIRNMGTTTISSATYNVIADAYGLQGIATQSLSNNYALSQDIDASTTTNWFGGSGFLPIGVSSSYTGNFNGQNHVINNFFMNRPTADIAGLFYSISGGSTISNVGLTNVNITAGNGPSSQYVGAITGNMQDATLNNVFVTGTVTQPTVSSCCNMGAGGLVGIMTNGNGLIENSYNAATVNGGNDFYVGGLVGILNNSSTISSSYNSGAINGPGVVGGLVGTMNGGLLENTYNIGTVTSTANTGGGLIGTVGGPTTIETSYSSGVVSGPDGQGGLFYNGRANATLTGNSYWDTETSGQSQASSDGAVTNATGLTTAQSLVQNNYVGWDFTNTWFNLSYAGNTSSAYIRPLLRSEFSTTIRNGHQLELIGMDGSQNFTVANDIDLGSAILNKADIWGTDLSSGNGFLSVGTFLGDSSGFTGSLNGNGHIVDGLYINWNTNTAPPQTAPALFSQINSGAVVENLGLTNVGVTASVDNGGPGAFSFWVTGTLQNVYSTGTVTAVGLANQVIPGGLASSLVGGTIQNSYSTVNVTASGSGTFDVGGLLGRVRNDINGQSTITNSYSTGSVTSPAGDVGGFVGQDNTGPATVYNNNFWDTTHSDQTSGVDNGNNAGVTGLITTQMMTKSNFTNAGWDFGSNAGSAWGIIDGNTYPFLQAINTGISGTAAANSSVQIVVNGANYAAPSTNGSGFFYDVARTTDIAGGSTLLVYVPGGKSNLITIQGNSGNSISGTLTTNNITIGDTVAKTIDNANISAAEGRLFLGSNDFIYSSAGTNLVLGNATASTITLNNTASNTYNIDGTISEASGVTSNYVFGGAVTLNNTTLSPTGTEVYNGAVTLAGDETLQGGAVTFNGTVDGGKNLTLSANTTVNGAIGQSTPLASLTSSGLLALNNATVDTSGNQTYNGNVTIGTSTVTANTVSGNIAFNANVIGAGNTLDLTGTGNNNFTLTNTLTLNNLNINGGTGTNTLTLQTNSASQVWGITAGNSGTVTLTGVTNPTNFSSIQNLVGGSNTDTFTLNGGTVSGSINGGGGTNTLTADNVINTWAITGSNAGTVTGVGTGFSNIQNLVGNSNSDSFTLNGGTISGSINGGGGTNTLTADNVTNTWNITGSNSGTVTGVTSGFSNIQNLVGGSGTDNFIFANAQAIGGSLNGGSGTNTLNLSAYSTAVSVNLQAATATGVGTTFSNIGSFIGGSGSNTLTGSNGTHSWNITANNGGNIDSGTTFSSFGNLVGGTGNDSFVIGNGFSINSLNGGTGTNSLDLSNYTTAVSVNLQAATATGITTTYSNIGNFVGGSGSNTLTGSNGTHSWNITANNGGNIDSGTTFSNFANLVGGTGNDSFVIGNGFSVNSLNGGTGTNSLDLSNYTTAVSVNLQAATATGIATTYSNIGNFVGGSGSNTLTGSNGTHSWNITANNGGNIDSGTTFSSFGNLVGGTGNDSFVIGDGFSVNSLNGGTGTNSLDLSNYTTAVSVNLQAATATGIGTTFSNISNFVGGSGSNTLIGNNGTHSWNITGISSGNIDSTTNFTNFGNLTGGTGNNTFFFTNNGSVSGVIDGGSSTNTSNNLVDFSGYAQPIILTLSLPVNNVFNAGSLALANNTSTSLGTFAEIQGVVGTNVSSTSVVSVPSIDNVTIVYNTPTSGTIGDPFSFTNMQVQYTPPQPAPTPTPTPTTPTPTNTTVIVQGTTANVVNNNNMDITTSGIDSFGTVTSTFTPGYIVNTNVTDMVTQQDTLINQENNQTKIGCY